MRGPLNRTMNDAVREEFVELHVVSKNVQSIRTDRRLEDLLSEVALCQFDLLCLSECWRADADECMETVNGDLVYLSGGSMYRGVGVIISAQFRKRIEHVSFHAYGPRVCLLKFCLGELKCECFSLYFPTAWDTDVEVEGMYETLQLLLDNCRASGAIPIIGGDFNASIGSLLDGEDDDLLGSWGVGQRTGRGRWLVQWILSNGLRVASRQKIGDTTESWTCKRFSDGMFVQIDFILADAKASVAANWNDVTIPLGLDHRCVHCRLARRTRRRRKQLQQGGMKQWKPHMDEQGRPAMFHQAVTESMAGKRMKSFNDFETVLVSAGRTGGTCVRKRHRFKESRELHTLRLDRRCARTVEDRKRLTFLIQCRHKQELRAWKTWKLNTILPCKASWKTLPGIQHRIEQFRNNQNQMSLPTCLRNSLLVILVVTGYRHNLQKLRGKKVRCTKQSSG